MWIDGIIDPKSTRDIIDIGINCANNVEIEKKYNVGIIQV